MTTTKTNACAPSWPKISKKWNICQRRAISSVSRLAFFRDRSGDFRLLTVFFPVVSTVVSEIMSHQTGVSSIAIRSHCLYLCFSFSLLTWITYDTSLATILLSDGGFSSQGQPISLHKSVKPSSGSSEVAAVHRVVFRHTEMRYLCFLHYELTWES